MADGLTPKLHLVKPDVGASDDTWGEKLNANFDILDLNIVTDSVGEAYVDAADALRVLKSGDIMSGPLTLNADPSLNLQAATKQYVDSNIGTSKTYVDTADLLRVLKAGDTMSGYLTLHANPTLQFHAATKNYVDMAASGGGGGSASISISDTVPSAPVAGALWWESDSGILWIYYDDGNTAQWVQASPGQGVVAADLAGKVSKIGDIMSGNLTFNKANPIVLFNNTDAIGAATLAVNRNSLPRWQLAMGYGADTGVNDGSIFYVQSFDNDGAYRMNPITMQRKGDILLGSNTPSTSPTTGALQVAGGAGIGGALYVQADVQTQSGIIRFITSDRYFYWNGTVANISMPIFVNDALQTTSSTTGALTVLGGVGIAKDLHVGGGMSVNGLDVRAAMSITAPSAALYINASIGGSPALYFFAASAQKWTVYNNVGGADTLVFADADNSNGMYLSQNVSAWNALSDGRARFKQNARPVSGLLGKLDKFRLVEYGKDHSEVGVIAQEFVEFLPQLVDRGDDEKRVVEKISEQGIWGVKVTNVGFAALQCCKELLERVKQLENK